MRQKGIEGGRHFDHGPVEEAGGRGHQLPLGAGREDGDQVPEEGLLVDTAVVWSLNGFEERGDAMIRVPVLADAGVVEAFQSLQVGRSGVGVEDGLPDGEDGDRGLRVLAQHIGDCGGPPQTGGSSRRDQEQNPGAGGVAVEVGLELGEGLEGERVVVAARSEEK